MIHKIQIKKHMSMGKLVKEAVLDFSDLRSLWFKFPESEAMYITERADPFVHALLFPMMECGGEFVIDGNLSRSVIDNVMMFSRIWNMWFPGSYKPIIIHANTIDDDYRPSNNKLITAFSGGLDAAYTTYKYKKNLDLHFKYVLDKSVMLLGADIPLREREQFESAFRNAEIMTNDLGIKLVPVETNYRHRHACNWSYNFGSVIMATLEFFSKEYFHGAASDDSVDCFTVPWGMNPITDQYLTSDTFRFISDGHEHSRTERANIIKNWETGMKYLRVCWRNPDRAKNCGKCEKCVRTKLNFMAAGVSHMPSMPNDLTKEELCSKKLIEMSHNTIYFSEILRYDERHHNLAPEWRQLLCKCIDAWKKSNSDAEKEKTHHSLWWHIKNVKF